MITKAEIYLLALLILAASLVGMWFFAKHEGRLEERKIWELKAAAATKADLDQLTLAVSTANKISQDTAAALAKRKSTTTIDRGVIQREIQTNTVYANDCLAPAGLGMWQSLSAGKPIMPGSSAGPELPAAVPSGNGSAGGGQQGRNTPAKPSSGTGLLRSVPY